MAKLLLVSIIYIKMIKISDFFEKISLTKFKK